jgi:hypothetical protein
MASTVEIKAITFIDDWLGVHCAGTVPVRGPILPKTSDIFFGKLRAGSPSGVARFARDSASSGWQP